MLTICLKTPESLATERLRYVLDFVEKHPLVHGQIAFILGAESAGDLHLEYGIQTDSSCFFIPSQSILFGKSTVRHNQLKAGRYLWKDQYLYSVEYAAGNEASPFFTEGCFGFDLFETIFFHISRWEEWMSGGVSETGEAVFFSIREGIESIPVVDRIVSAFCEALGLPVQPFPSPFILTHDLDKIFKYNHAIDAIKAFGWPVVYRFDLIWGIRNLVRFMEVRLGRKKDPYDSYSFLFRKSPVWQEKRVYFMAGGKTRYDLFDHHYLKDFQAILPMARNAGYEPALHPSYLTASDEKMMQAEIVQAEEMTGQPIHHSRQHFLHLKASTTFDQIERCGFETDSSLGFTRRIGFRCGTGFPYHLYNFHLETPYSFVEVPLIVMDSALIHQCRENMHQFRKRLMTFVRENSQGTQICFNFHNSSFDPTLFHRRMLNDIYLELERLCEEIHRIG